MAHFKGPAQFFIYGGPVDGSVTRIPVVGANTLEEAEDIAFRHRKDHPQWEYRIYRSKGWEEVKE